MPLTPPTPPTAVYSLIENDGTQKINWESKGTRGQRDGARADDQVAGRQTRLVHQRIVRTYAMPLRQLSGAEINTLVAMAAATRGGGLVAWRHPTDDTPGGPSGAPLWLVTGTLDALRATRNTGSVSAQSTINFEEVWPAVG